jgi:hypothetical protein
MGCGANVLASSAFRLKVNSQIPGGMYYFMLRSYMLTHTVKNMEKGQDSISCYHINIERVSTLPRMIQEIQAAELGKGTSAYSPRVWGAGISS